MEKKIDKILIVNYEYPPLGGGGGVSAHELAKEWSKKAQVDVLTSSYKDLPSYEVVDGVNVYRSKIFFRTSRDAATFFSMFCYLITGFIKGVGLFRKHRYSVINTHFAVPSGPLGFALSKLFGVKNVLSIHGGDIYDPSKKMSPHKNPLFKAIVKWMLESADHVVAQSSNTRDNALHYYKPKNKIDIIPLAFTPPVFPKASKSDLGIKRGDFVLVGIGRLVKRKAFDDSIKAVAKIDNPKLKLFIIGDGPEREFLQETIKEQGVEERVILKGFLDADEKYQILSNANLMLMTSLHEGFGIIFQEAMFCGLPIVCTNHGGQVDFIIEEINGLLCDVGDIDSLSKNIQRFVSDKKLYKACAVNNKRDIKKLYADKVATRYEALFRTEASGVETE